ncbi:U3 small nucleolar ribonucleoprotein complex, subunit Mpp10 [Hygrophoropsis aurantiaca]|uniref:U3 small nucleolar ribonucleoprotein complex, subunit Mpp10 n=1 Tax=Hygrophoropsis aurantiaca TaxID=72124 RepID=A0ACB8AQX8_9AGAM|nr:U3 small nucleolar ribonucleoprotein complex, subunit Mpp10 [Hygrophoropsis aurantiaca]
MTSANEDLQLPYQCQELTSFIEDGPERLAHANTELQTLALRAAKFVFDLALQTESISRPHVEALLSSLSPAEAPRTRSQTRTKRKRSPSPVVENVPKIRILEDTPLPSLYVEDMNEDQIWEQLDLRAARVCKILEAAMEGEDEDAEEEEHTQESDEDAFMDIDQVDDIERESEDEEESEGDGESVSSREEGEEGEEVAELRDETPDEDSLDGDESFEDAPSSLFDIIKPKLSRNGPRGNSGKHSELDDGFFDLAAFNAETEEAETKTVSRGRLGMDADDNDSTDEGLDVDLFRTIDGEDALDEDDLEDAGEPFYKDFFDAPFSRLPKSKPLAGAPPKVRFHDEVKIKSIKAKGKGLPVSGIYMQNNNKDDLSDDDDLQYEDEFEGDSDSAHENDQGISSDDDHINGDDHGSRAIIERLKDDLFAEEQEEGAQTNLSAHEKRMAELRAQIKELENENIAKKDWVLMGEASSKSRPHDSLLQEDLEFDRAVKAVPIITEEVVQGLEQRIKARILENRYNDVIRIRPIDDKPFLPSRLIELQDTKSTQSLAQIYENEYTATRSGSAADDRDGRLHKEHDEIEKLWDSISNKLDALCNAHYVPKQPKAIISTVASVPAASLESALPTSKTSSSMLAPEEIFTVPTDLRARSELTPTEKRALRTKERKTRKRARDALDRGVDKYAKSKSVKTQKAAALRSIIKSGKGVAVVGKKSKDIGKDKRGSNT